MRVYGKLLGLIAGWLLLRHPAGGVIGLIIGHAFDADWFRRAPKADPYAVLGIHSDATDAEVERAYRRLITLYHPDRLEGVAPELRAQAEAKAAELNAALEEIRKLRASR